MGILYSTRDLNVNEQFDYWREELCHIFVELEPERNTSGNFNGSIYHQPLTQVTISRVTADAHTVSRTPAEISRSSEECFFANLQLHGTGINCQGNEEKIAKPGDLVLIDARRPYDIKHQQAFDLISVKIPCELLRNEQKLVKQNTIAHIPLEHGYASLLRNYTTTILDEFDTGVVDTSTLLSDNLISLISISLYAPNSSIHSNHLTRQQYLRLQDISGYINCHLTDPELNINQVASYCGLTPRYIQKLFAATGVTFSGVVLKRRLKKCALYLRSPEFSKTKLSEIALMWGFNDFSYFSRTFKQAFGVTPREYKKKDK